MINTSTATTEAEKFYEKSIALLRESGIPFLVGGTFAVIAHTGIARDTKDIDFFCKASDYPKLLNYFTDRGYRTVVEDERWLAKVHRGEFAFDLVFNAANAVVPVTDTWFAESTMMNLYGMEVHVIPPAELVWSKAFIADRYKYDGADIAHVMLKKGDSMNWDRLLGYFDQYWEVLLSYIINFRFIYPSEREQIPRKILDELLDRLREQAKLPVPHRMKVCRGRLFSRGDYAIDVEKWGFADIIDNAKEPSP